MSIYQDIKNPKKVNNSIEAAFERPVISYMHRNEIMKQIFGSIKQRSSQLYVPKNLKYKSPIPPGRIFNKPAKHETLIKPNEPVI